MTENGTKKIAQATKVLSDKEKSNRTKLKFAIIINGKIAYVPNIIAELPEVIKMDIILSDYNELEANKLAQSLNKSISVNKK